MHSGWVEAAELSASGGGGSSTATCSPTSCRRVLADAGIRFVTGLFLVSTAQFLGSATTAERRLGVDDPEELRGIDENPGR